MHRVCLPFVAHPPPSPPRYLTPPPTVWLVHSLQCGDQDSLLKVLKRLTDSSVKREVLHAVSRLLADPRGKVCSTASSLLRGLAEHPLQRERVRLLTARYTARWSG